MISAPDYRDKYWTQQTGERIKLREMGTRHCFHTLKCLYNWAAMNTGRPLVWNTHSWRFPNLGVKEISLWMAALMAEIEARGDLADKYAEPYRLIKHHLGVGSQEHVTLEESLRETEARK